MKQIAEQNKTFRGSDPTWANACVGENGNPQIYEYASGYASAANTLLQEVIKNEGSSLYVDTFIYPICFNIRHAIELFLKATAVSLEQLAKIRSTAIPHFDLAGSHDLGNIWNYVREHAMPFDSRYVELLEKLNPYIVDVAETDATGQVFRYPFDLDNKKHLTSVSVINVVILKDRWSIQEKLLRNLNRLNEDLLDEYSWGGFTSKLSRPQLAKIAEALPPRDHWSMPDFSIAKATICKTYNLSSNDFCKALNVIQSRRELAAICSHVVPIAGLDSAALLQFLDIWMEMHDLNKVVALIDDFDPGVEIYQPDAKEIWDYHEKTMKLRDKLVETLKPEAFGALRALFNFDRDEKYSEIFEKLLSQYQKEAEKYSENSAAYLEAARHLLQKTSGITSILNSLNFLGQKELVGVVVDRYKLKEHIDRLIEPSERARARLLQGQAYV